MLEPAHQPRAAPLPHWPIGWYVVARSADLAGGRVASGRLGPLAWVLYRTRGGELRAMDARCPHMGAHLCAGRVEGEAVVCALHHRTVSPSPSPVTAAPPGPAPRADDGPLAARRWPCFERFGLAFLHPPAPAAPAQPFSEAPDDCEWITAAPQPVAADWLAMICNGFDLGHMRAVHQREVVGQPEFTRTVDGALRMDYRTRVLPAGGWSSWLMARLSGGELGLRHTCHGTVMRVDARLGALRSSALFGLLPQDPPGTPAAARRTLAFGAFGLPRRHASAWRLRLARALYLAFLRKDFRVVEGMDLTVDGVDDPAVLELAAYLRARPSFPDVHAS